MQSRTTRIIQPQQGDARSDMMRKDFIIQKGGKGDQAYIDATRKGNAARFLNHSCEPNVYTRTVSNNHLTGHRSQINIWFARVVQEPRGVCFALGVYIGLIILAPLPNDES